MEERKSGHENWNKRRKLKKAEKERKVAEEKMLKQFKKQIKKEKT